MSRLGLSLFAATAALVIAAASVTLSRANFAAQASNPGNSVEAAADFCTTTGTTVSAGADSWINQASTGTNYGSSTSLEVQSTTLLLLSARRALVRFPLTEAPQFCTLTGATLRLYRYDGTNGRSIEARKVTQSWSEGSVTWSNQPSATTTNAATTSAAAGWNAWDVTAIVQQTLTDGVAHGFMIRDANETALLGPFESYRSREYGTSSERPELVLEWG